jgi:hypothetical protein
LGRGESAWWRFSEYELRNGYIQPAPGAGLDRYDPWSAHRTAIAHGAKIAAPPYAQLATIAAQVPTGLERWSGFEPSADLATAVLEWCRCYGLLGTLLHDLQFVRLGSWTLERANAGCWSTDIYWYEPEKEPFAEVMSRSSVGALPENAWYAYLPSVPKEEWTRRRPEWPFSEEFWLRYAEPINDFLGNAKWMAEALVVLGRGGGDGSAVGPALDPAEALSRLNDLTEGVSPGLEAGRAGRFHQRWFSHSLLGHLSMQAAQDLLGEKRLVVCHQCSAPFTTSHPKARFCSERCNARSRKRKQREREGRLHQGDPPDTRMDLLSCAWAASPPSSSPHLTASAARLVRRSSQTPC